MSDPGVAAIVVVVLGIFFSYRIDKFSSLPSPPKNPLREKEEENEFAEWDGRLRAERVFRGLTNNINCRCGHCTNSKWYCT